MGPQRVGGLPTGLLAEDLAGKVRGDLVSPPQFSDVEREGDGVEEDALFKGMWLVRDRARIQT